MSRLKSDRGALQSVAPRIARETVETWERHVRKGREVLVRSHQESLPRLAKAALSYGDAPIRTYLTSQLDDDDEKIQEASAEALGNLGDDNPTVIQGLLDRLEDESPKIREAAAQALGEIGADDWTVVERLIDLTNDRHWEVRQTVETLGQLETDDPAVVEALLDIDPEEGAFVSMVPIGKALNQMDADGPKVVERLINLLGASGKGARMKAIRALGDIGVDKPEVIEHLNALVENWDFGGESKKERWASWDSEAHEAVEALKKIGADDVPDPTAAETPTRSDDSDSSDQSTSPLLERFAKQEIIALAEEGDRPSVRSAAVKALSQADSGERAVIDVLSSRLKDDDSDRVRRSAAAALETIGNTDPVVIDALVSQFNDERGGGRVAKMLKQIGMTDPSVFETILSQFDSRDQWPEPLAEVIGSLPWHAVSEKYLGSERTDLSGAVLSETDHPAVAPIEDEEHAVVHWQALARLPE